MTTDAPTARALRDTLASGQLNRGRLIEEMHESACAADAARLHRFASLHEGAICAQVAERLELRCSGQPLPPLWGVPVAVKDIIDTTDFPTECGSPLYAGRYPVADATVVRRLRGAGAIIFGFGKTVTTEFAIYYPGPTRITPSTRPGGSSSPACRHC